MSEWRGLHNPDQHRPSWNRVTAWCDCDRFGVQCTTDYPCRCCLAAEVERLAERIALAVAFCDEFSGVQVAVTTARILRSGS